MNRVSKISTYLALVVLVALLHLNAKTDLVRSLINLEASSQEAFIAPTTNVVRVAFLNHQTMAADTVWVTAITNHGGLWIKSRKNTEIINNANVIADLDPLFYDNYILWSSILTGTYNPSETLLIDTSLFLERAMQEFPTDPGLPNTGALMFIRGEYGADVPRRQRETILAIGFAERAADLDHEQTGTGMLNYLNSRMAKLQGRRIGLSTDIESKLALLAQISVPDVAENLRYELTARGCPNECANDALLNVSKSIDDVKQDDKYGFLPTDMWLLLRATP